MTNLNDYVKDFSVSSKISMCGRRVVVQHHTIESVGVFWLNDFLNYFFSGIQSAEDHINTSTVLDCLPLAEILLFP